MIRITPKDKQQKVDVYFIRQFPDGREKSGYFQTTLGALYEATKSKNDKKLEERGFLWLHTVVELHGFAVGVCWSASSPVYRGGWTTDERLTDWDYKYGK